MTADEMIAALEADGGYRVLRRLVPPEAGTMLADPMGITTKRAVILDCETTGLDPAVDEIIELAMLPFTFCPDDGAIVSVETPFAALRQPSRPIPPQITEITGLSDAIVEGKSFNLFDLHAALSGADLVIAHHAEFDRPFAERLSEVFVGKCWACSMSEVDWKAEGYYSRSLAALLMEVGLFYERHRALSDAQATLALMGHLLPKSGRTALAALLDTARGYSWHIWAIDAPFTKKDTLKAKGYRWNPGEDGRPKSWHIEVRGEEGREAELGWLRQSIYGDDRKLPVDRISAFDRFATRQLRGTLL